MYIRFAQPVFGSEFRNRQGIGSVLDDVFTPSPREASFPAVDVVENEGGFELVAEVPGMKKDDVQISLDNRTLTLSGERKHYGLPEVKNFTAHPALPPAPPRASAFSEETHANRISA